MDRVGVVAVGDIVRRVVAWLTASLVGLLAFALARGARRPRAVGLAVATAAFVAAALDAPVSRVRPVRVAVLVDRSPSARGMPFDRATVEATARRLAPRATLEFLGFADGDAVPLTDRELDAPRTRLPAVDADAVLLFSDGNVESIVAMPPTFPVAFDDVARDARVVDVQPLGDRLVATVANDGPPRTLAWPDGTTSRVGRGTFDLFEPGGGGTVALDAGDAWPENDRLDVAATPMKSERWWIGGAAPAGYRAVDAAKLPPIGEWLAASVVVLNDVPADAVDGATLARYVRDLGGGVLVLGGPHAFSAGGYAGTALDAISPLASAPPGPRHDWFVLVDASGSMAQRLDDGRAKLDAAVAAAVAIGSAIPASESVVAGSVARDVRWWPSDRRIAPPTDLAASGATNLAAAIDAVAVRAAGAARPSRLAIVSDGEATFADVDATIARCRAARLSVDWLALPPADARGPLARIVAATGGARLDAGAADAWPRRAAQLARSAGATPIRDGPIEVRAFGASATIDAVNVVFPRENVEAIATDGDAALAATWPVGLGRVTSVAFAPPAAWREAFADAIARRPVDPRFATTWTRDAVTVDAADPATGPMNGLSLSIVRDGERVALEPIAPGRYRAPLARETRASIAIISRDDGARIDARALPSGFATEFDRIGVDRAALDALAARSGGRVVDAREAGPIAELPRPRAARSARGAILGAGMIVLVVALLGRSSGMRRARSV